MIKKIPLTLLIFSIISLVFAISALLLGSSYSKIYNQMKKTPIVTSISEIIDFKSKPFLIFGSIAVNNNTLKDNLVAYKIIKNDELITEKIQPLNISLKDGIITLLPTYHIADATDSIEAGSNITIYAVRSGNMDKISLKGYELYPGGPDQYINFLSSPYNNYMTFVRIFIGLSLLFFMLSIVINIKK